MEPIGPLMHEHRLIERMIRRLESETQRLDQGGQPDMPLLCNAVDFIATYADRCHHGKEEDILFQALQAKDLSDEHRQMLDRLIQDHRYGRELVGELKSAMLRAGEGDPEAASDIADVLRKLVEFYPEHIRKEDKEFFHPALDYLTEQERSDMLGAYESFEKELLHEKYNELVQDLEERGR